MLLPESSMSATELEDLLPDAGAAPADVSIEQCVQDESAANRVVRRILDARAYRAKVERWAMQEMRRAEREEQFLLERFGGQLEAWTRQRIAVDGRMRSVRLPAGRMGFRTSPERLVVVDAAAASAWCCMNCPSAVKVTAAARGEAAVELMRVSRSINAMLEVRSEILLGEIRGVLRASGELPSGVSIVPGADRFYVS
jgi:hypothetical protein